MNTDPAPGTFTCECCGGTFTKGWSDQEARDESVAAFGELAPEDQATVCDPCYAAIMAWARGSSTA